MLSKQIIKGPGGGVFVLSDGTIRLDLGQKDMIFSVDNAAHAAQGLLKAVAYVSEQIANSMEDAADTVQEAKEAITEMKEQTGRFEKLE